MAVKFTQARVVAAGAPLAAGDAASLAQAVNTRLTSGVGDMARRIAFYLHSGLFRKMRNDNGTLATADAEFWGFYQGVAPTDGDWPSSEPGDIEGANVANPINAFVFGAEALDMASERTRLDQVPVSLSLPEGVEATAEDYWNLAKYQRGAFDVESGDYSSPMLNLGISYAYIRGSLTSPHFNSYGGYMPTPADAGGCDPVGDYTPPNLQIYFTNLSTAEVVTYCGTCPDTVGGTCLDDNRVQWVAYTPFAYIVFLYDGTVDYYAKNEWIEGPYTANARLTKTSANALSRVVAEFASGFKGDATQRLETDGGQANAFPFQEFLTSQFPLAPQIGTTYGDSVAPVYPAFFKSGADGLSVAAGGLGLTLGGTTFAAPANAVTTHFLAVCRGVLTSSVTLTIMDEGETVSTVTLTPVDGYASRVVRLASERSFVRLSVETTDATFSAASGVIACEFNALLPYKPQLSDAYSVLRLSTFTGSGALDGAGIGQSQSREIYTTLRDTV